MLSNISTFIFGSIIGIISELIVRGKDHHCYKDFNINCLLSATIFNLYGYGLLLSKLYFDNFGNKMNIIMSLFILSILMMGLECIGGKLSYWVNGRKNWNYDTMSLCDGYVSIPTTLYFMVLIYLYYIFIHD